MCCVMGTVGCGTCPRWVVDLEHDGLRERHGDVSGHNLQAGMTYIPPGSRHLGMITINLYNFFRRFTIEFYTL